MSIFERLGDLVKSNVNDLIDRAENPEKMEATRNNHPYKRLGRPDDYVGAAIYLASDASAFVNGEVIIVDSGKTVK